MRGFASCLFFFFNDTATTEIYTLSLHDALPISTARTGTVCSADCISPTCGMAPTGAFSRRTLCWRRDRKSTRLNSSHGYISYAVFCLKKKKQDSHARDAPHRLPLLPTSHRTLTC